MMSLDDDDQEKKMAGIKEIAVVDDKEENLEAARIALTGCFPNAKVRCFSSASSVVTELMFFGYRPSLVLTDLDIEEEGAGYKVNMAAWGHAIPAVIITSRDAGGHHGTTTSISMLDGLFGHSKKDDPETWKKVMQFIMDDETYAVHYAIMGYYGKWEDFSNEVAKTFDAFAMLFLK